ncbi:MAG: DUF1573 domain-containing protein [Holophagaceae bacterium]|nr:DUF1573 domain-containing protein [Holophagaceae bacterium]
MLHFARSLRGSLIGVCLSCAPLLCTPPLAGLVISQTEIDFGTIASTQPVSHTITIKNESQQAIDIARGRLSCGCLSVELPERNIPPSSSINLTFRLNPTGYVGDVRQTAELGFRNESGETSTVVVSARAFVQDPILLSAPSLAFQDITLKTDNGQGYYKSDPILLSPVSESLQLSPLAEVPEQYGRAFLTSIGKRGSEYVLEAYFFPQQAIEATDERNGNLTIKIYTDGTKSQFVNLPIQWHIKSNFSVAPAGLLFIDGEPQDADSLIVKTVDGSPFEISEISFRGKTLDIDCLTANLEGNEYQTKLSNLPKLISDDNRVASSELIIVTNHEEETAVKVPVTILFTNKAE